MSEPKQWGEGRKVYHHENWHPCDFPRRCENFGFCADNRRCCNAYIAHIQFNKTRDRIDRRPIFDVKEVEKNLSRKENQPVEGVA